VLLLRWVGLLMGFMVNNRKGYTVGGILAVGKSGKNNNVYFVKLLWNL
jgi:hypothetical protein